MTKPFNFKLWYKKLRSQIRYAVHYDLKRIELSNYERGISYGKHIDLAIELALIKKPDFFTNYEANRLARFQKAFYRADNGLPISYE